MLKNYSIKLLVVFFISILINIFTVQCKTSELPILNEGRIKQLNFIFKNFNSNILNMSEYEKTKIAEKLIFNDKKIFNKKIFKIKNENVLNILKLNNQKNNLYSFNDIIHSVIENLNFIKNIVNKNIIIQQEDENDILSIYLTASYFIKLNLLNNFFHDNLFFNGNEYSSKYEILISDNLKYDLNFYISDINLYKYKFLSDDLKITNIYTLFLEDFKWINLNINSYNKDINKNDLILFLNYKIHNSNDKYYIKLYNEYSNLKLNKSFNNKIILENIFNKINFIKICSFILLLNIIFILMCIYININKNLFFISVLTIIFITQFQFLNILNRILITGNPPVTNLFESILFINFMLAFGIINFLYFYYKKDIIIYGSILIFFLNILTLFYYNYDGDVKLLLPVLNTNFWLIVHVITISSAYALCLLFSFFSHISLYFYCFKNEELKNKEIFFNINFIFCILSSLFSILGTILGGIWADHSWGRFWGWDPKENGAFLIILWLVFILHFKNTKFFNEYVFYIFGVLTSVIVSISWFGVNLLNTGLHSYGFVSGIGYTLFYFCLFELCYILFFILLYFKKK